MRTSDILASLICCVAVDFDDVVADVASVRSTAQGLSEEYIEYNHDPIQQHVTVNPVRVVLIDNGSHGLSDDEEDIDCPYRDLFRDWNHLVVATRRLALAEGEYQGREGPFLPIDDRGLFNHLVRGLLLSAVRLVDGPRHHACQYHARLTLVADAVRDLVATQSEEAMRAAWDLMDMAYEWPCVIGEAEWVPLLEPNASGGGGPEDTGSGGDGHGPEPPRGNPENGGTGGGSLVAVPVGEPTSVYRVAQDVVEVKRHRRIRKSAPYIRCVVAEIKNRLGCPSANAANLLAVRRMAINIMEKHGVRPSHIRAHVEVVIAGVFVPDREDQRGAAMLQAATTAVLRQNLGSAGPKTVWHKLARWLNPTAERAMERLNQVQSRVDRQGPDHVPEFAGYRAFRSARSRCPMVA